MGILNRFKKQEEKKAFASSTVPEEKQAIAQTAAMVKAGAVASRVVLSPVVTEKSAYLAAQGQYIFDVEPSANKIQVKNAIRAMYAVTPVSVNVLKQNGKKVRVGRTRGKRKDWKKAIVTLQKGKTIEVYEGV